MFFFNGMFKVRFLRNNCEEKYIINLKESSVQRGKHINVLYIRFSIIKKSHFSSETYKRSETDYQAIYI